MSRADAPSPPAALALFLAFATLAFVGFDEDAGAVRAALVVSFVCFGPGAAVVLLVWRRREFGGLELVVSVAVSIAIAIASAQTMILARWWRPEGWVMGLAGATALAVMASLVGGPRPSGPEAFVGAAAEPSTREGSGTVAGAARGRWPAPDASPSPGAPVPPVAPVRGEVPRAIPPGSGEGVGRG